MKIIHSATTYQLCTRSLYFQDYEDHVASMHYGLWKYKCGWCLKLFDSKIECLKHNKVHRPRKKHEFKNPRPKVKETSEPLICADCGKIYQNKQSLRVHVDHFHNKMDLRDQSFTSLMADLRQDINRVSSFSRCLNGTFPWRNCSVKTLVH